MNNPNECKKKVFIERYLHVGLFDCDVFLLIGEFQRLKPWCREVMTGDRQEEFLKMLGEDSKVLRGRQYPMAGGGSVIFLPFYDEAYLVHEIGHAALHMLRDKDTPINSDTEEVFTYLQEHLWRSLSGKPKITKK